MLADPTLMRQRRDDDVRRGMKMSVDGESCPCCDVVCVTLQVRSEDFIARSVAGLCDFGCRASFPLQG